MSNREARLSAGDEATLRVARHPWANDLCQPRLETRNGAYRCSAQAGRSTAIALWSALEQQFDGGARQLHATTRTEAFGLANPVVSFWHEAAVPRHAWIGPQLNDQRPCRRRAGTAAFDPKRSLQSAAARARGRALARDGYGKILRPVYRESPRGCKRRALYNRGYFLCRVNESPFRFKALPAERSNGAENAVE